MADVGMMIRIAANIDDLKRKMAEGGDFINFTTAAATKLANSLNGEKLSQRAHDIVTAVEKVGGAVTLTTRQKANMNRTLAEAIEKYERLGKQAPTAMIELEKATRKSTKETSLLDKAIGMVGPRLLAAFSVGAVVGFAKQVGSFAGKMQDLSDQTGIGVERLQALNYIGAGAGLTIEDFGTSVDQLSRRLASGDASAVGALERLNMSIFDLQRMAPDQAFIAIGQAVAKIENPMERTRTAMELFGRSGGRMLRIMTEDLGQLVEETEKSGAVISKELIEAADRFDDRWTQAIMRVKAGLVSLAALIVAVPKIATAPSSSTTFADAKIGGATGVPEHVRVAAELQAQLDAMRKMAGPTLATGDAYRELSAEWALGAGLLEGQSKRLLETITAQAKATDATKQFRAATAEASNGMMLNLARWAALPPAIHDAREEIAAARDTIAGATHNLAAMNLMMQATVATQFMHSEGVSKAVSETDRWGESLDRLGSRFEQLANTAGGTLGAIARWLGTVTTAMRMARDAGQEFHKAMERGDRAGMVSGAIGAIGAVDAATSSSSRARNVVGGAMAGAQFGSAFGPIGTGIGAAAGGLVGLFRGTGEAKKIKELREQFVASAGGLEQLRAQADAAGVSLTALFSARKVRDYEAALARVTGEIQKHQQLTDAQAQRQQMLTDAVARYGFTLAELGPTMQRQQLAEQAERILTDFKLLGESGIAVETVIARMGPSINEFVQAAIKTGTEVPEAMRPILETMMKQGLLTDEAGNKITDLEAAGVTFGKTLTDMFKGVLEKLDELIEKLSGGLPSPDVTVTVRERRIVTREDGDGGERRHDGGLVRRAHGGMFMYPGGLASDEVPIIAQTGEGVLSRRGMAAFDALNQGQAPAAGPDNRALLGELRGLRADLARQADLIPIAARDAALLARAR